jgi:Ca2+-binding EF-hand superfamily protein
LKVIFEFFDRTKTGLAHYLDLMSALRGFMSEYRQSLVDQTYESLIHTTKREYLTVEEVVSLFSASSVGPLERPAATQIVSEFIDLIEKYHSLQVCSH